jgi:hypothetical protein
MYIKDTKTKFKFLFASSKDISNDKGFHRGLLLSGKLFQIIQKKELANYLFRCIIKLIQEAERQ